MSAPIPSQNSVHPASPSELSDALRRLGVEWNTPETLHLVHDVAIRSHQSAIALIDEAQRAAAGVPAVNPDGTAASVFRNVIEALLIPERLPADVKSEDELLRLYLAFETYEHAHASSAPAVLDRNNAWTIRSAVQSLWRDAFRSVASAFPMSRPDAGSNTWSILQSVGELLAELHRLRELSSCTFDQPIRQWRLFTAAICSDGFLSTFRPAGHFAAHEYRALRRQRGWEHRAGLSNRPIAIEAPPPAVVESVVEPPLQDATPSAQRTAPRAKKRGRPPVTESEASERMQLLAGWDRAAAAGVTRKDFCLDRGIDPETLDRAANWHSQQKTRKRMTK